MIPGEMQCGTFFPPSTTKTLLPSLRSLRLRFPDPNAGSSHDLGQVASLLERAPNLELLEVSRCLRTPPGLALGNLKWLKLNLSVLTWGQLTQLAAACPKLEAFISHVPKRGARFPGDLFGPGDIVREILPCKDTLRHFEISFGGLACGCFMREQAITSLKEFANLQTLVLDCACLCYGVIGKPSVHADLFIETLPASIETIFINFTHHCMYKPILTLAWELRNGTFPHLKTFRVTRSIAGFTTDSFGPLKSAMSESGVLFTSMDSIKFNLRNF
ncbi:hypothetical protein QBC33DRAFT_175971 [Phialemonium atrogriseum]|uniref:F-box domain-containing protein n=1 Tax=Phialemonium atrogriseum TaxID=1093897 RepID=A0AAJ0BVJ9_9PEZI|nr:uncharacterized protein QBC33DRAFT_175971 [Phialemonium atrogriseum]KAK1765275.1 hypothetical protein QBC33DRAFT_175971 [Phialemonium atrogriseum]